jgi:hypothetical protein
VVITHTRVSGGIVGVCCAIALDTAQTHTTIVPATAAGVLFLIALVLRRLGPDHVFAEITAYMIGSTREV